MHRSRLSSIFGIFHVALLFFLAATIWAKEATYTVLVPKLVRPGLDFVIAVQFQSRDRVKVVAQIKKDDIPFAYSTMDYVARGNLKALNIRIPQGATSGKYELEFSAWRDGVSSPYPNPFMPGYLGASIGENPSAGFGEMSASPDDDSFVSVQNKTQLTFKDHTWSIFIQTDKPKYKPGDLVRFRVFAILPNLRPYMGSVDVTIFDPKGNQMKKLRNHRGNGGYASGVGMSSDELQLAESPNLGMWKIKARIQGQDEEAFFIVEKYVLPKFEVSIVLPEFVSVSDDEHVAGIVKARYTFGQGVDGTAEVRIDRGWRRNGVVLNLDMVNGEAKFKLTVEELKNLVSGTWNSKWDHNTQYKVRANVSDHATGTHRSATENFIAYNHKEKVKFVSSPRTFKPGMKYVAYLKVTQQDGKPLLDAKKSINVTYTIRHKVLDPISRTMTMLPSAANNLNGPNWVDLHVPWDASKLRLSKTPDGLLNLTWAHDKIVELKTVSVFKAIPSNGLVKVEVDLPKEAHSLDFKAIYGNQSEYYAEKLHVSKAFSPSDSFLKISQVADQILPNGDKKKLKAGGVARFIIRSNESPSSIFYLLLGRGTILGSGQIKRRTTVGNTDVGSEHLLQIQLNTLMSPSVDILVYYTRLDGEVVADSIKINVDGVFNNQVSIGFNKVASLPGERANLIVKAAPNSLVAIKAVDMRLQLLQENVNDVTVDAVKLALDRFRGNDPWNPWYCPDCDDFGRWSPWPTVSGAVTAAEVFRKVNVHVLTDGSVTKNAVIHGYRPMFREEGYMGGGTVMVASSGGGSSTWGNNNNNDVFTTTTRMPVTGGGGGGGGMKFNRAKARKEFPETWLWTEEVAAPNGETLVQAQVPDAMTTWVASAFALHPILGLGVAEEPAELLVSKPFFVSLQLPYSIVRGEEVALRVVVFNYDRIDLETTVVLPGNSSFENIVYNKIADSSTPLVSYNSNSQIRRVRIPKDGATSVYFPIRATKAGLITIQVMAQSNVTVDYVERVLVVEPEGLKKSYTVSTILTPSTSSSFFPNGAVEKRIPITFPSEVIADSASVQVSVIGDVMGGAADALSGLVRLPTGCGEQNLVNLAPSVFILRYLKVTQRFAPTLTAKALKYIKAGYQQELSYQRKDGSFSAWGDRDSQGSTWLTAFVIKIFGEALEFDSDVDPYIIGNATNFILHQQFENGSFNEPGIVYMRKLQGGGSKKSGSIALTAYVASALLEILDLNALPKDSIHRPRWLPFTTTTTPSPRLDGMWVTSGSTSANNVPTPPQPVPLTEATIASVKKAMNFLRSHLSEVENDPYAMALVTYALHQEKDMFVINGNVIQAPPRISKEAEKMLAKLELKAKDLGDGRRYWPVKEKFSSGWRPSSESIKSSGASIETSAYAILTYLKADDVNVLSSNGGGMVSGLKKSLPVIQWLASQANELGGYRSTQDTVMALQALSTYSQRSFNPSLDLSVELRVDSTSSPDNFLHTFVVNNWNAVVLQMRTLPSVPREVELVAKGNGSAVAKVAVTYHVPEERDVRSFDVDVDFRPTKKGMSKLHVCAKSMDGKRGMTIFQIRFPSGFGLPSDFNWKWDLQTIPLRAATNFEFGNSKADVYFDELDDEKSTCVTLDLERHTSVSKIKPVPISVFDYYDPDFKTVVMYGSESDTESTLCDFLGDSLTGCSTPPPFVPWNPAGSNYS